MTTFKPRNEVTTLMINFLKNVLFLFILTVLLRKIHLNKMQKLYMKTPITEFIFNVQFLKLKIELETNPKLIKTNSGNFKLFQLKCCIKVFFFPVKLMITRKEIKWTFSFPLNILNQMFFSNKKITNILQRVISKGRLWVLILIPFSKIRTFCWPSARN